MNNKHEIPKTMSLSKSTDDECKYNAILRLGFSDLVSRIDNQYDDDELLFSQFF